MVDVRIVITEGSGLIGQALTSDLLQDGYDVIWLSRSPKIGAKREPTEAGTPDAWRLNRPHFLPAPAFALRLALGEKSALITDDHCFLPEEAQAMRYAFQYTTIEQALDDLLALSVSGSSRGR